MNKRSRFRNLLMSAAVVSCPIAALASDAARGPVAQPSSLRVVSPDATATVHGLRPVPLAGGTPKMTQHRTSSVTQVQHSEDSEKKPGFIKRLFGKLKPSDDSERGGSTQFTNQNTGTGLPAPPPIDYSVKPKENGIVATPAGFNSSQVPAHLNQNNTGALPMVAVPLSQNSADLQKVSQAPIANQAQNSTYNDGFINPFRDGGTADAEANTLLDLDSLIEARPKPKTQAVVEPAVEDTATALMPAVVPQKKSPAVAETKTADGNGPYTGIRLPSEDEVLGLPEEPVTAKAVTKVLPPKPQSDEDHGPLMQPVEIVTQETTVATVISLPAVDDAGTATQRVPVLEEPVMSLPPVEAQTAETESAKEPSPFDIPQTDRSAADSTSGADVTQETQAEAAPLAAPRTSRQDHVGSGHVPLSVLEQQARRDQQRYRILARTGQTGFKGFCPVELRDHRELIDSREEFHAKFGLQTYYFSSPEAKAAFDADPARYAPAAGGSDVVLLVNTGEESAGSLDFSLWYRDRLYLFRSRETQALFSENPQRFANEY
ncbi:MAG: hypothetical protein R3C49_27090 [Planctomycetaceae bacterium]